MLDSRTLQSTPESGGRAGYDVAKRRKGSKAHMAVAGTLAGLHFVAFACVMLRNLMTWGS